MGTPVFFFNFPGDQWLDSINRITVNELEILYEDEYLYGLVDNEEMLDASEMYFIAFNPLLFPDEMNYQIIIEAEGYENIELAIRGPLDSEVSKR